MVRVEEAGLHCIYIVLNCQGINASYPERKRDPEVGHEIKDKFMPSKSK